MEIKIQYSAIINVMAGAITTIEVLVIIAMAFIPVGVIMGVMAAIKATNEENKKKKGKLIWRMILYFAFPFILLFMIVAVWGLFIFFVNKFIF